MFRLVAIASHNHIEACLRWYKVASIFNPAEREERRISAVSGAKSAYPSSATNAWSIHRSHCVQRAPPHLCGTLLHSLGLTCGGGKG